MSTTEAQQLIGRPEDDRLEFKGAEILGQPTKVAREIVALLNASGGEVWIGVQERDGVATSFQAIPNAVAARDALWNHLVDTIEPSPLNDEVSIGSVAVPQGGDLIKVAVKGGPRRPYALLKDRGRQFLIRTGARLRDMSREEVGDAFRGGESKIGEEESSQRMAGVEAELVKHLGTPRFWWTIVPKDPMTIDFEHMKEVDRQFCLDLLTNSQLSDNRRSGWTMVLDHEAPKIGTGGVVHTVGEKAVKHATTISRDGTMTFLAPRTRLARSWDANSVDIFPFALIELPVSTFRMASKFLKHFAKEPFPKVIVAAVIGGMKGVKLRPGSPAEPHPPWKEIRTFEDADLVVQPFEVDGQQLVAKPDAAAYRLVLRLYEQFGFDASDIPREFDATDHVLRLGRT